MSEMDFLGEMRLRCFPLRSFHFQFPISNFHETLSSREFCHARGASCRAPVSPPLQPRLLLEMEKDGVLSPKFVYIALKLNLLCSDK